MGNAQPEFKNVVQALDIAKAASEADDWELCRQALEYTFDEMPNDFFGYNPSNKLNERRWDPKIIEGTWLWLKMLLFTGLSHSPVATPGSMLFQRLSNDIFDSMTSEAINRISECFKFYYALIIRISLQIHTNGFGNEEQEILDSFIKFFHKKGETHEIF